MCVCVCVYKGERERESRHERENVIHLEVGEGIVCHVLKSIELLGTWVAQPVERQTSDQVMISCSWV